MLKNIPLILIAAVLIFSSNPVYAGWDDFFKGSSLKENIPLPRGCKELHSAEPIISGRQFTTTIYTSDLSQPEIESFYEEELARSGWSRVSIPAEGQVQAFGILSFTKDDRVLNITFLPTSKLRNKTTFSVTDGTISKPEDLSDKKPERVDFMPLYPAAEQITYTDSISGISAGYTCNDSIEVVADFYRRQMPVYGWVLQRQVMPGSDKFKLQYKQCPTCADYPQTQASSLQFSRDNGDICIIGVTQSPVTEPEDLPKTTINVNYVKGQ